jgi:hypothetical protein
MLSSTNVPHIMLMQYTMISLQQQQQHQCQCHELNNPKCLTKAVTPSRCGHK